MITCTVLIEGTIDPRKRTFLTLPRVGEEVQLSTAVEASVYYVKHITHFAEGATPEEPEADILIELTERRPDA